MLAKIVRDALLFWTTIDPIGTVVLFALLTTGYSPEQRRKIAVQATCLAAILLVASIFLGQLVLAGLGIRLISLQVAGGLILFVFGLQMIFRSPGAKEEPRPEEGRELAVFPLAIPSIAGPGTIMAVIVATDREFYGFGQQVVSTGVLLAVLLATLGMLLGANGIIRVLGRQGSEAVTRVMGMLLAALSVELVMEALGVAGWVGQTR
jgi:multiple antibiotic resistance protein